MQKVESFVVDPQVAQAEQVFDYGTADAYPEQLYEYTGIATGIDGFASVTDAHLAQFHEEGYLVVHNAFTPAEVQDGLDGLFALIAGQKPAYRGLMFEKKAKGIDVKALPPEDRQDYVRKFMWFVEHEERLKTMAEQPKLLRVIERLMGEPPVLFQDMALIKPPRIGREKPWHQDHAYFDLPLTTTVVGVWIALDEATTENGCMIVYPGSHRQGPVVHFQRRDWQICDTHTRQQEVLAVPLQPGGCLLFHSLIHHGTPANNSTHRRRAVQFHYKPQSAVKTAKEERLAVFGEEGKDVTC
ncbi:MAG: phytanoyl-CoA dioxygenase family protein [Caldilineaceae bacterium]